MKDVASSHWFDIALSPGVVTPPHRMDNGKMEIGE